MKAVLKESTSELKAQNAFLKGRKLLIKLGNLSLHQEVYLIPRKTQISILVIQDMLSDDGEHSQEYQVVKKILAKTLEVE
ncbi:MAG: hypothetical protein L3J46_07260 [Kangiellaceae bacterium]|nr:hypothetical protein [Kangiellaceae bacterium]